MTNRPPPTNHLAAAWIGLVLGSLLVAVVVVLIVRALWMIVAWALGVG